MPVERGDLIDHGGEDRNRPAVQPTLRRTGRPFADLGQEARAARQKSRRAARPMRSREVHQRRARRGRHVGHVIAGQLLEEIGVGGAEAEMAGARQLLRGRHLVENPAELAGREIRIERQAGEGLHLGLRARPSAAPRPTAPSAGPARRWRCRAARRSRRSQATTVSPWLASATASAPASTARAKQRPGHWREAPSRHARPSRRAAGSADGGWRRHGSTLPASSTSRHLVEVVPWSMAAISMALTLPRSRSRPQSARDRSGRSRVRGCGAAGRNVVAARPPERRSADRQGDAPTRRPRHADASSAAGRAAARAPRSPKAWRRGPDRRRRAGPAAPRGASRPSRSSAIACPAAAPSLRDHAAVSTARSTFRPRRCADRRAASTGRWPDPGSRGRAASGRLPSSEASGTKPPVKITASQAMRSVSPALVLDRHGLQLRGIEGRGVDAGSRHPVSTGVRREMPRQKVGRPARDDAGARLDHRDRANAGLAQRQHRREGDQLGADHDRRAERQARSPPATSRCSAPVVSTFCGRSPETRRAARGVSRMPVASRIRRGWIVEASSCSDDSTTWARTPVPSTCATPWPLSYSAYRASWRSRSRGTKEPRWPSSAFHRRYRHPHLLLRSTQTLAAREQREHQRPAAWLHAEGNGPFATHREDLDRIARSLNNRPRKTLGHVTPSQRLAEVLAETG